MIWLELFHSQKAENKLLNLVLKPSCEKNTGLHNKPQEQNTNMCQADMATRPLRPPERTLSMERSNRLRGGMEKA